MNFLNDIQWRNGQAIDIKERNMIIYLSGCGFNPIEIANALSKDIRTVNKWLYRFETTGNVAKIKKSGRPKSTNINEDFLINLHAIQNPKITLNQIKTEINLDCHISTIGKILNKNKLFCRVARIKEHLSVGHKARRLEFAQDNLNFHFWDRTIFVDEANFMTGTAYRQLIRRPIGSAYEDRFIIEKKQSGRRSVPVFGIMHAGEVGPLIRIEGNFDSEKYLDILDSVVLPYIEDHFPDRHFYYYQDNSRVHYNRIVTPWYERNFPDYQLFRTPAKSFDINPIENLWGVSKVRVAENGIFDNDDDLWLAISDNWNDFRYNSDICQTLVNSIPNRLQAIINNNGGHTKY